jgi:hypothetical protein
MAATKNYVDFRTPFRASSILLSPFPTVTGSQNITTFNGFTNSAAKQTSASTSVTMLSVVITVNYSDFGYVPVM